MTVICKTCSEKRSNNDCIVYPDYSVCDICLTYHQSNKKKTNYEKLENCDVYSLKLSNIKKNYYGFIEWGQAKEMGKFLVLVFDMNYNDRKWKKIPHTLLRDLMKESRQSFRNESKKIKNAVIKNHPKLEISSFIEYKKYLKSYMPNE